MYLYATQIKLYELEIHHNMAILLLLLIAIFYKKTWKITCKYLLNLLPLQRDSN